MSRIASFLLRSSLAIVTFLFLTEQVTASYNLPDPYTEVISLAGGPLMMTDSMPIEDRYGNWIEDPNNNPFDLLDPIDLIQEVEYDPATNTYILTETIGGQNYRSPTTMTYEEYLAWDASKSEGDYFKKLAGAASGDRSKGGNLDPVAQVDVSKDIIDRLFGGTTVDIRPQGNVDLTFGLDYYRQDNPILPIRQQRNGPRFDFDMDIQVDVNGQIGEKLNTSFNYNTSRTFDFQNKLKLDYNSDMFSDDEILKSIEAGNVSLPLNSTLIKGSQSLFGIKAELQFGHLRLTAIASQQNSKQNSIQIQGGSVENEFTIYGDQYDENRHFFLSQFNRNAFEGALNNLPQINSLFRITRMEVWVTNNRNQTTDVRDIIALSDAGEYRRMTNDDPDKWRITDTASYKDICMEDILADNNVNTILPDLRNDPEARELNTAVKTLQEPPFNFVGGRDFEKIQGRKLSTNEYRFNPDLGFISLNIRLDQDEVLGVAYEYTYNGQVFQVGELSTEIENTDTMGTQKILYVKMLKATNQRVDLPIWDLMMKNVYRIGGGELDPTDFELDVFYDDTRDGFKRFLPDGAMLSNVPLINIFSLDNLNVTGDPQPDGKFDFITGITINPPLGIVMFPVLEPFAGTLRNFITNNGGNTDYIDSLVYPQLYDSTLTIAREFPELNRFTLRGKSKSSTSSDISLGAFNIPPGSVRVTAGGQQLKENEDYTIDYNIGRIKIINPAFLQPSTPINVSFEDNALFSFNKKTMLGLRADYEVNEHLSVGGTYLHLYERPYTQKVNIGDDPINNRIYGLDLNYSDEAPWLTKIVDKIPGISTNAPSNITFEAEMAALRPGHSRAIDLNKNDKGGAIYLDDFEGTKSNFDLRTPTTSWFLASTPQNAEIDGMPAFTESALINDRAYGANRAMINWYRIDQGARSGDPNGNSFVYTRLVSQQEIFQNRTPNFGLNDFRTFDITYVPDQRGPYNFDLPDGGVPGGYTLGLDKTTGKLIGPETRWGGIMRSLNQVNFEQANIDLIEFWVLDPFLEDSMGGEQGKLVFQLGNISEDILRDSRKFFEHGLPLNENDGPTDSTAWGKIPRISATVNAFSNATGGRDQQDVGLDGLTDEDEQKWFGDYLQALQNAGMNADFLNEAQRDPANDNFVYFLDGNEYPAGTDVFTRYSKFNGTHGNSPLSQDGDTRVQASTNIPDSEDINNDNSMSETESYFEYVVEFQKDPNGNNDLGNLNTNNPLITDYVNTPNGTWYRFRLPLDKYTRSVGGIQDFRSIRFMRMFLTQFTERTTLRFATFDLIRNQWRRVTRGLECGMDGQATIFIDGVNIEENSDRVPFRYDLPLGIQREQITSSSYQNVYQNEQSLSVKFVGLEDGCQRGVYKNLDLDLRVYKGLEMFVHAEEAFLNDPVEGIPDDAVKLFIRLGSDFVDNYYEYEVPLVMSRDPNLVGDEYKEELWRVENMVEFALDDMTNLKISRNESGFPASEVYSESVTQVIEDVSVERKFSIKGNPTLGYVRNVLIGIRNAEGDEFIKSYSGEVWVNELRMVGLDERGGVAAVARLDADLADFGSIGLAGGYSSIGFGSLDQKLDDRSKESVTQIDFSTNLALGKFFGANSRIQIPFYYQYSETLRKPQFDALDLDLELAEKLQRTSDQEVRDSVREQSQDFSSIKQISITNLRVNGGGAGKPMPYDITNFAASYSYSRSFLRNVVVEKDQVDQHRASLDYIYSIPSKPLQPFKNLSNSIWLKWLTELNLNPIPSSFTFNTVMDRKFGERSYRFSDPVFQTWYAKRFTWDRTYSLRWDLTKSIKINFNAANASVIDEPDEYIDRFTEELIDPKERRDSIYKNILKGGRTKDYNQQLRVTFAVPLKTIPIIDWIRMDISYDATYSWRAASINTDSLGNVISNGQTANVSTEFDLVSLYNKSKFLAQVNGSGRSSGTNRGGRSPATKSGTKDISKPGDPGKNPDPSNKKDAKKGNGEINPLAKAAVRLLMSFRKFRINYGITSGTTIPGFTPKTGFFGLTDKFTAPGVGFVTGGQPKINKDVNDTSSDYLEKARSSNWITTNAFQNSPVLQSRTEALDSRISIEPVKDFKIDMDFTRNLTTNFSVFFKTYNKTGNTIDDIGKRSAREIGSFTISYLAIPTLFMGDSLELNQLFNKYEANRAIISKERGTGTHEEDGAEYTEGFGRKQQDILTPAFLSAYTNKSPTNFDFTDMFSWIPSPNWTLNYSGLSKLNAFKGIFSNIRLTHGYKASLSVNQFTSDLNYTEYDPDTGERYGQQNPFNLDTINKNYYSQFLLPTVIIEEAFSPLIGLDMKFTNEMNVSFGYSKRRTLSMGYTSYELAETRSTTVDFGFDWKLKNVRIGFLPGFNSASNKKKPSGTRPGAGGTAKLGNDLNILLDISFSDNITLNHLLDQTVGARATRGSKDITISPAISYDVNKNISLRFFVDYRRQSPYVSNSFLVINTQGGITVRIKLE